MELNRKWWHDRIAYQIYPASFMDGNGDGMGDLAGILQKLDYLKELGISLLWLSPIYQSPMADKGYDISDYYAIDPRFGTMEEMDCLLEEAKKRDIKVLMDLVINHSSDEHIWFQEALKEIKEGTPGKYASYYIFKEGRAEGAPNNWRSLFGGSAWERVGESKWYYLHVFHKKQPDLNWENKELREEIYHMVNWWLEKGLGGFRLDAVTYLKKDQAFLDGPADGEDGLCSAWRILSNRPGIEVFLKELRDRTFRPHDCFTVGEASGVQPELLSMFMGEDGCFSSIFDFTYTELDLGENGWHDRRPVTLRQLRHVIYESQKQAEPIGFYSNVLENHDQPRVLSKLLPPGDVGFESASMLAAMSLLLRGIPFIYQGQEIGMTNDPKTDIRCFDDIATHDQYQRALEAGCSREEALEAVNFRSRDHTRTPMQWNGGRQAGFTAGTPWLPVNENYREINVEKEEKEEGSLLSFYKKLIALRTGGEYRDLFVYGSFEGLCGDTDTLIAYQRRWKGTKVRVVLNFSGEEALAEEELFFGEAGLLLLSNYDQRRAGVLRPYEAAVYACGE